MIQSRVARQLQVLRPWSMTEYLSKLGLHSCDYPVRGAEKMRIISTVCTGCGDIFHGSKDSIRRL